MKTYLRLLLFVVVPAGLMVVMTLPNTGFLSNLGPQTTTPSPTYNYSQVKYEALCMERTDREYNSVGLMKAELGLSEHEIKDFAHRLDDNGYVRYDGFLIPEAAGSEKWFEEVKTVEKERCNELLEYSEVK